METRNNGNFKTSTRNTCVEKSLEVVNNNDFFFLYNVSSLGHPRKIDSQFELYGLQGRLCGQHHVQPPVITPRCHPTYKFLKATSSQKPENAPRFLWCCTKMSLWIVKFLCDCKIIVNYLFLHPVVLENVRRTLLYKKRVL